MEKYGNTALVGLEEYKGPNKSYRLNYSDGVFRDFWFDSNLKANPLYTGFPLIRGFPTYWESKKLRVYEMNKNLLGYEGPVLLFFSTYCKSTTLASGVFEKIAFEDITKATGWTPSAPTRRNNREVFNLFEAATSFANSIGNSRLASKDTFSEEWKTLHEAYSKFSS